MLILVAVGSFAELLHNRQGKLNEKGLKIPPKPNLFVKFLIGFSTMSNTRKLFEIKKDRNKTIGSIHGMRILCTLWIIVGHTYAFGG